MSTATTTLTPDLEARVAEATSEDPLVAATAAAVDFLQSRDLLARVDTLHKARRQRVLDTFKAAGIKKVAGVLVSPTTSRVASLAAVLRIKNPKAREALVVQTVPLSNIDAALKAGVITARQYDQIVTESEGTPQVTASADDGTALAA